MIDIVTDNGYGTTLIVHSQMDAAYQEYVVITDTDHGIVKVYGDELDNLIQVLTKFKEKMKCK